MEIPSHPNTLLKQEGFQLAEASFRDDDKETLFPLFRVHQLSSPSINSISPCPTGLLPGWTPSNGARKLRPRLWQSMSLFMLAKWRAGTMTHRPHLRNHGCLWISHVSRPAVPTSKSHQRSYRIIDRISWDHSSGLSTPWCASRPPRHVGPATHASRGLPWTSGSAKGLLHTGKLREWKLKIWIASQQNDLISSHIISYL